MKRKFTRIWMLLALWGLAACTPDNELVEAYTPVEDGKEVSAVKVTAHDFIGAENITRTLVEVGNEGATFLWDTKDTIGIYPLQDYQVAFPMTKGAGTQSAEFDGGGWALKPSTQYMAYYPFAFNNRNYKSIPVSYVGQMQTGNGNTDHLGAFDYMAAGATTPIMGAVAFDFQHLGSLVQFKLKVPEAATFTSMTLKTKDHVLVRNGSFDLSQTVPAIQSSDKVTSVSMELKDIRMTAAGQELVLYMMMAPADLSGQTFFLKLSNDKGKVSEVELEGKKLEAGRAYAFKGELSAFEASTLEIADRRGKAIGSEGGIVTLSYLTNTECEFLISKEGQEWITPVESRAATLQNSSFSISENTGDANRRATITVKSLNSNLAVEYIVVQGKPGTYAITETGLNIPVGILSCNYPPSSEEHGLENLLDNNLDTYFEVNQNKQIFIDLELPYSIAINSMAHAVNAGECGVSGWTLHISYDGEKYDGLGWSIGINMGSQTWMLTREVTTRSQYFRFLINGNHGAPYTRVSELAYSEDFEADKDLKTFADLVARGSSFTKNENTPMGNHYDNRHVTTKADREWLAKASNEPDLLPSAGGYTWRKYDVNLYPYGDPVPADINQHGIGDCSALAVFAEMAYLFPDFIKSIITDHGNGTYTVAMYDPQGNPVDVTLQSTFLGDDNGIGASSGKDGKANWGTILEKAIMKWNKIYEVNKDIYGIGSEHVAPLFTGTGESFGFGPNSLLPKQLDQAVDIALEKRMIVIGGFNIGGLSHNYGPQTVTAHAYSYLLSTDWEAMFAMRNPWGNSPGGSKTDDGVVNIYDDGVIPQTIDMRIIYPGAALEYAVKNLSPYAPPTY